MTTASASSIPCALIRVLTSLPLNTDEQRMFKARAVVIIVNSVLYMTPF